jgi:hypothetical protein
MTQTFTKLFYNSSEERIEAVAGDDYESAVVVFSPLGDDYSASSHERRENALQVISRFVQQHPTIKEGSDGQCWRADYTEVVLPVYDFTALWLEWYYRAAGNISWPIEPGHALWERTAGGEPLWVCGTSPRQAYTLEDAIREGAYEPTEAYYRMVGA